ncbi:response regulator transcription factor [Irregularibacter muris]|uniref:Stage 0 sporulation protein A homolog n=1 Tax=Irregularibacter muris TaxID=1796619 RepID=A0AAE3HHM9_9FIRM|nr:response regulator transcription factor [Irregularibacter muris]MCR1899604.1 response regulator transcription factor [Irregularibacter muris]
MDTAKPKVLIVEDETSIRKFISINLKRDHFDVLEAGDGESALEVLQQYFPQVVVLDVMLPKMDGFEVCYKIREIMPECIIIMLTAKAEDMDKIMGLELGADDYMVKPFNPLELVARIRANLRKVSNARQKKRKILFFQDLKLDIEEQRFYKHNVEIELTPTEFFIMKILLESPGKVFKREEILKIIWGENYYGDMKTVDVHIRRIREKLEENPSIPQWIETVWGVGYRLKGDKTNE